MQPINLLLWLLPTVLYSGKTNTELHKEDILFCYGKVPVAQMKNYRLIVLESAHYTQAEISILRKHNQQVLAYLSLGEVNANAKHYPELKEITLGKNKNWNSYYLNLRKAKTIKVLNDLIDSYLSKGFTGVFFDNLDNFTAFGPQKDDSFFVLKFLSDVRLKYKGAHFLQNAGIALLDKTKDFVNGVVVESVATSYSFTEKKYGLKDKVAFDNQVQALIAATEQYNLPLIVIEYADTLKLKNQIISRLLKYNITFFISKIHLQTIPSYE